MVIDAPHLYPGDAVFYGVTPWLRHLWTQTKIELRNYWFIDNGYAPCPEPMFRITFNALQIDGTGRGDPVRRDRSMPRIRAWRKTGKHIVVCMQSEPFHEYHGIRRDKWLDGVLTTLRAHTDRPIIIRDKPIRDPSQPSFRHDLRDAWAVVTWTSRCAVEAIIEGVPAFVTERCAASPMACADLMKIESPVYPAGRMEWAAVLAANQWSFAEMRDGTAWNDLRQRYR